MSEETQRGGEKCGGQGESPGLPEEKGQVDRKGRHIKTA